MSVRSDWFIVLFKFLLSLLIFCQDFLSIIESKMFKFVQLLDTFDYFPEY